MEMSGFRQTIQASNASYLETLILKDESVSREIFHL